MTLGTRESTRADATRGNAWVESKPMGNQRHGRARLRLAWRSQDIGTRVLLCCLGGTLLVAMVLALVATGSTLFGRGGRQAVSSGPAVVARKGQVQSDLPLLRPYITVGNPPAVRAAAAFLLDPERGRVYYQKHADDLRPMASTTKVMTLLLALETGYLNQQVTVGQDAAALVNSDNSYMGLSAGERLTLRGLLYGLALPSGNAAGVAIADDLGGSAPGFVVQLNQRAQQLGLTHPHYISPDGLDDANRTSARDLAVLASRVLHYPAVVPILSTRHYVIPATITHKAYDLWSGNDLLSQARAPYPGAIGVKPGFTYAARYCQAFAARRHGYLVVGAVLGDWSWRDRIADMRALLDWGFAQDGVPPAPPPIPWAPISPNV